jgi:hypothetical protein
MEITERTWLLSDVALALPRKVAGTLRGLLGRGATQPGRDGIDVPPMSDDWLQQSRADGDKHGADW